MMETESKTLEKDQHQLPSFLTISTFSAARGKEIEIMRKALATTTGVKLAFQKLPKHMRRRAMSHNVKRLPRKQREMHMSQMKKSGIPPKQKRPSRKFRRRPSNLNAEYARRQKRVLWLNTHIWHAKRFHMIEKWGYKLPFCPCDRAFRACYRATTKHCLLQDISYHSCIELRGDLQILKDGLAKITDSTTGLSFQARCFLSGGKEGTITIFRCDNKTAIGTVFFIWRPNKTNSKTLWIWVHAAFYNEILDNFKNCFNLKHSGYKETIACYENEDTGIELLELKNELSRFRLTGPLSNAVLQNCFKLPREDIPEDSWFKNYFENKLEHFTCITDYWNKLKYIYSPSEISPHSVFPVIVEDPRFHLPKKRTKARPFTESSILTDRLNEDFLDSPLWDPSLRKIITDSKISQAEIAKLRSNLLVPGTDLEENPALLSVILIQRPGSRQQYVGYGTGWDIILPSAWAQPLWLSLIMWGARSGGLKETNSIDFESDRQYVLHPDTKSGQLEEQEISSKARETFFKLPPNKRTNYNKFGISSPFCWNWQLVVKEWCSSSEENGDFFVLRDRKLLLNLQQILKSKTKSLPNVVVPEHCLIPVCVQFRKKGPCKKFALICLPKIEDLKMEPSEPHHVDPNEKTRKTLRKEHKSLLKRLRRRRVRAKKDKKVIPIDTDMLKKYTQDMRKLWIPETTKVRHSCSREVMGFVKHGDFSFLSAKAKAIGYITGGALNTLLKQFVKNTVLIRNIDSRRYRLGTVDVICE